MKKILILAFVLTSSWMNAQEINPVRKTISVTGSAEMEFVPDQIFVSVELKEYFIKNNKTDLDRIKTTFLSTCKRLSIPDSLISVSDYGGDDNAYSWKRRKNPDLQSSITYEVKFTNFELLEKFASMLDDKSVERFGIAKTTHSKIIEFRKQLKMQAIQACKNKAAYLTEAIGEKAGEAITITEPREYESNYNWYYNRSSNYASNAISQTASSYSNLENGKTGFQKMKLRYEMEVVFALK